MVVRRQRVNETVERMWLRPLRFHILKTGGAVIQEMHLVTTSALEDRGYKLYVLLVALLFRNNRQVRQ